MKFTNGELIDINARVAQILLDLDILDECKTLDEARKRLRQQASKSAKISKDGLQGTDD
ncbi:MAG: hypothetical protein LBN97_01415 [Oscillospiraceae bacterium]|jgi:hypoxanthine-guanine phosphoribosyltransferase|nr:hypothetical protein [Oscillospiraceae bacterium]